jgi:SAM-dependent methyltransferase
MPPLARLLERLRPRRPADYLYSERFAGRYAGLEEAVAAHAGYKHDTDAERQFDPSFRTYVRVADTLDSVPPGATVLDLGCNSGGLGRRLIAEKGCRMFGVDVNPELVERAVSKGYDAYTGLAEDLRYDDESFDVVVASELLEHVFDPALVLAEARRVLKPGGLLLGDVPTETGHWGLETIADHRYHARVFTRDSLDALLSEFFLVEDIQAVPPEGEDHPYFDVPTWYVFRCRREDGAG